MADNGLPSSYKLAPAPRTPVASPAPASAANLPSSYKPPAAPAAAAPPPPAANPPPPPPAPPPAAPTSPDLSNPFSDGAGGFGGPSAAPAGAPAGFTAPQPVRDFGTVASNEAMSYGIPSLRTQAEAARKQLPPKVASAADLVGGALSPTNLLYAVPYAGPGLAGGLHEGIKSWEQGNDAKTILEDTAAGVGAGYLGVGAAKVAPAVLPQLTKEAVKMGPAATALHMAENTFGPSTQEALGALRVYNAFDWLGEKASEGVKYALNSPVTQQAIKNLTLGGAAALRTGGGPWDQWIPGQ